MFNLPSLHSMALMLPAIILGLTFHEYAHGWVADRLGDHTARYHGRLTINPWPMWIPLDFYFYSWPVSAGPNRFP